MAKKIFLRDENNVKVLPITRGELILDSSGNPAFHSNEFLATDSQPGLMSPADKQKLETVAGNTVDTELSNTSTNPVQNKVLTQIINSIREKYLKSAVVSGNKVTITDQSNNTVEFVNSTYQIVTNAVDGLVPKYDAVDGTIDAQTTDWVLTNHNGTLGWYKLPTAAFSSSSVQLFVGAKSTSNNNNSNSATTNGNTYLKLFDNSTLKNQYNIKGTGLATVISDASGTITINVPTSHNQASSDINSLTGYTKATAVAAIATSDSLNSALGKLELKADTTYELVKGAYDGDGTIENLAEILKVLEGIKDTETIQAIVGKYLPLTGGMMSGNITFDVNRMIRWHQSDSYSISCPTGNDGAYLLLKAHNGITAKKRLSIYTNAESLPNTNYNLYTDGSLYANSGTFGSVNLGSGDLNFKGADPGDIAWYDADNKEKGRIYYDGTALALRHDAGTTYKILHTGNAYISNGTITINGVSITPLTSIPAHGIHWENFTKRATSSATWGTLTSAKGYTPIFWLDSVNGGGVAFSDYNGQTSMQIDGNYYANEGASLVLHTANYNSYAPTLTGTGASGTWGINISGNADTVDNLHASDLFRAYGTLGTGNSYDSDWGQSIVTFDPVVNGTYPESNPNVTILNLGNNYARRKQLAFNYNNNNIYFRRRLDSYWQPWVRLALASEIPAVTNYYWADQLITGSAKSNTTPTFGHVTISSGTDAGLRINTSGDYSRIRFYNSAGSNNATIHYFATAYSGYTFAKDTLNIGGIVTLGAWNNPTMYVTQNTSTTDKSGKVGIQTTSPTSTLDVNGDVAANYYKYKVFGSNLPHAGGDAWYNVYQGTINSTGDTILLNLSHSYWYTNTDAVSLAISVGYGNASINQISATGGSGIFKKVRVRFDNTTVWVDVLIYSHTASTDTIYVSGLGKGTFKTPTATSDSSNTKAEISIFYSGAYFSSLKTDQIRGPFVQYNYNSWLSPAYLQLGRADTTVYTDRGCIGITDGNLHIDAYKNKDIYLNYYQAPGSSGQESTALVVKSTGNVGIGTASPIQKLQVKGAGVFNNTGSTTYASDGITIGAGDYSGRYITCYGKTSVSYINFGYSPAANNCGELYFSYSSSGSTSNYAALSLYGAANTIYVYPDYTKSAKYITAPNYTSSTATGTQPYACTSTTLNTNLNADYLDGYHESAFLRYRDYTTTNGTATLWSQIGIRSYHNALPEGFSGLYNYGQVVSLPGNGSRLDIFTNHTGSSDTVNQGLWWRSGWNDDKREWRRIIDSGNIGSQTVNRAYYLYGHGVSPDNSHPGHGARVFYSWNTGQAGNSSSGYSNGITIGSHPSDTAYGFQIVQNMWDDTLYVRRYNAGWQSWRAVSYTDHGHRITKLHRRDDSSDYSLQHHWTGSYWYLRGYYGDSYHAGVQVAYADNSGYASSAGNADTVDNYHATSFAIWRGDASTDSTATDTSSTSTADFFAKINATSGLFNSRFGAMRGSWWYVGNTQLDTGVGTLEMAGTAVLNLGSYADTNDTYKSLLFLDQGGRLWSYTANETAVKQWSRYAKTTDIKDPANYYWANIKVSASSSTSTQPTFNTCYTSNWFRSTGATGWYNETYTGGIYMEDSTWVRTYNGKSFYCSAAIQAGSRFYTGYDSGVANSVSCSNWFRSSGDTGWYNASYDGGWYMSDSTWVRSYNSKGVVAGGYYHTSYGSSAYALTSDGGVAHIGSMSVNYANSAGSASYAHYLPTKYDGGQQTNPQTYFNNGIGLRVAMTGLSSKGTSYWSDTLWINGYSGGDVPNMCALHFNRDGTPRAFISTQSNQSSSYGTLYELITGYNIGSQSVNYANSAGSATNASNVYINTSATSSYYPVPFVTSTGAGNKALYIDSSTGTASSSAGVRYNPSSNALYCSGGFFEYSDETAKIFFNDIAVNFDSLKRIPKKYFVWKDSHNTALQIGTSAQKLQEMYPELVTTVNGKLAVSYEKLSVVALKAIDELYDMIVELRQELNYYKTK